MEQSSPGKVGKTRQNDIINWLLISVLIIISIAVVLLILFFLFGGKTNITGNWRDDEATESIICSGDISYPFFTYENTDRKEIKINASFSDEKMQTISLVYKMYYNSDDEINRSANLNHAAMNRNFGKDGLTADAYNATYNLLNNAMQMSIYSDVNDFNALSAKYFLLSDISSSEYTRASVRKIYENKGLMCKKIN